MPTNHYFIDPISFFFYPQIGFEVNMTGIIQYTFVMTFMTNYGAWARGDVHKPKWTIYYLG